MRPLVEIDDGKVTGVVAKLPTNATELLSCIVKYRTGVPLGAGEGTLPATEVENVNEPDAVVELLFGYASAPPYPEEDSVTEPPDGFTGKVVIADAAVCVGLAEGLGDGVGEAVAVDPGDADAEATPVGVGVADTSGKSEFL